MREQLANAWLEPIGYSAPDEKYFRLPSVRWHATLAAAPAMTNRSNFSMTHLHACEPLEQPKNSTLDEVQKNHHGPISPADLC